MQPEIDRKCVRGAPLRRRAVDRAEASSVMSSVMRASLSAINVAGIPDSNCLICRTGDLTMNEPVQRSGRPLQR